MMSSTVTACGYRPWHASWTTSLRHKGAMGVHHSTYYRWRRQGRWGIEALRDPDISPHGVNQVLACHGLSTRRDPWDRWPVMGLLRSRSGRRSRERNIDAMYPARWSGMDCFYLGRLSGTKGTVWQYTPIDVHSGSRGRTSIPRIAAAKRSTPHARLARSAAGLAPFGWDLKAIPPTTDGIGQTTTGPRTGRYAKGRTPAEVIGARKTRRPEVSAMCRYISEAVQPGWSDAPQTPLDRARVH
jgi:hypothetical protein